MITAYLVVLFLAFFQNVAFTLSSRSRNRDHMRYHAVAATLSNGLWFLTMRELITMDMALDMIVPYMVGTVSGSLFGAKVSMKIEQAIGALADPWRKEKGTL